MTTAEPPSSPPRDGFVRTLGHALGLCLAALGLFAGPAAVGTAPSNTAAVEDPQRWFAVAFALVVLGLLGLALARWQRPWHQRGPGGVVGGVLCWLAWGFGAMLMGAGGFLPGLLIMGFGAWLHRRRYRRKREASLASSDGGRDPEAVPD